MNALVFDLGTTYFKAGIFDPSLKMIAFERIAAPITPTASPHSEIAPDRFLQTILHLADRLRNRAAAQWSNISRISFASQANSFLLLDQHDSPLTPIILWNDQRAATMADLQPELDRIHPSEAYAQTGVPRLDASFLSAKLIWIRRCQPAIWERASRVCTISDYFTWLLIGKHVAEASLAGLTGLADIHRLAWRESGLESLEISSDWLPEIRRAGTSIGRLDGPVGKSLDLMKSCTLVAGCLDQFAGAIGAAGDPHGTPTETTGTVLATVAPADGFDPSLVYGEVFQGPGAVAGRYFRLIFGDISAALLETYRNQLPDQPDFAVLDRAATEADLPSSMQLDTARWLEHREIRFIGDTPPTRGQAVRAIQVAVAEALAEQVRRVAPQTNRLHAAGGAAQSRLWIDLKSRRLGIPVVATAAEPTLRGAAVLAFMP